jgi:hypothetical protein
MSFILSNDPRPFYAHVSNMTDDRLLYPLAEAILDTLGLNDRVVARLPPPPRAEGRQMAHDRRAPRSYAACFRPTDAIFVAPSASSVTTYRLYSRNLDELHNPGLGGLGGQMTDVRIHPAGTLAPQTLPQT